MCRAPLGTHADRVVIGAWNPDVVTDLGPTSGMSRCAARMLRGLRRMRKHVSPRAQSVYVTFRPNFHHFDRFELDPRGHIHVRGAASSCLRLRWADMVLI